MTKPPPVGKLKAELDGARFEAELDGTLRWRTEAPHLELWLNSRCTPETQGLRSTDRPYSSRLVDLVKGRTL